MKGGIFREKGDSHERWGLAKGIAKEAGDISRFGQCPYQASRLMAFVTFPLKTADISYAFHPYPRLARRTGNRSNALNDKGAGKWVRDAMPVSDQHQTGKNSVLI